MSHCCQGPLDVGLLTMTILCTVPQNGCEVIKHPPRLRQIWGKTRQPNAGGIINAGQERQSKSLISEQ